MRCPKCQYISFEGGDKCRNCGYEISLSLDPAEFDLTALDLPIRSDEPSGPFTDLVLTDLDARPEVTPPPQRPPRAERPVARQARPASELPLFRSSRSEDDAPLVSLPASPRAPAAVRKSSAALRTPAPRAEEPALAPVPSRAPAPRVRPSTPSPEPEGVGALAASHGARLGAAAIDVVLIAAVDAAVLYFTLQICGLEFHELRMLPVIPFVSFLTILNGSYLVTFTAAGGQTLGKMTAGIRVVNADRSARTDRVPLAQAFLRSAAYVVSALPAGLGFLPAFIGEERRGLHDRIAQTRVVKA